MRRSAPLLAILFAAEMLAGCGRTPQDLGFADGGEQKEASAQGYLTKARMMESRKPVPLPDYSAIERSVQPAYAPFPMMTARPPAPLGE